MMRKLSTILTTLLVSTAISANAQSAPPACLGALNVLNPVLEQNDTVYACVGMPLTFEDASLLEGLLSSRTWDFGDGTPIVDGLLSSTVDYTYDEEGVYTFTLSVSSALCSEMIIPQTVVVLGNPTFDITMQEIDCFGNCNGELSIDVQSPNEGLYSVVWDAVGVPGTVASGLCAGSYNAVITDGLGCTDLDAGSYNIPEPDQLLASIDLADTIDVCPADGITNLVSTLSGGTGSYSVDWGLTSAIATVNSSLAHFTPTANSLDQMYTMVAEDDNGCTSEDSVYIRSTPSILHGNVTVGSQPCGECEVFQYHYDSDPGVWHVMGQTMTLPNGDYDFGLISNFIPFTIMADPASNFGMVAPAFYPNGHKWSTASVLNNVCGLSLNKDIQLEEALVFSGSNTLRGVVLYDASGKTQTEEDPIPLIDVVVEKTPPGQAQGRVETNAEGEYEFTFVPNSDTIYTIYVSMPGVPVTSTYEILANSGNETYCDLDFCLNIDSTEFVACNGEANPCGATLITGDSESALESFSMYPNPSNGTFTIETGKFAETNSEVRITDTSGRLVFRKSYAETPYFINMVNVAEGYYVVQMLNSQEADASSISVLRY
jgi:PKD repeat protein